MNRSVRRCSVKRFERSNVLDTVLYKTTSRLPGFARVGGGEGGREGGGEGGRRREGGGRVGGEVGEGGREGGEGGS